jgi:putative membrane protein
LNKLYRPKSFVSRYYQVLFTLPKWQFLAAAFLLVALAVIAVFGARSTPVIFSSVLTFAVLAAYRLAYRDTVFWKLKRVVGLSLAVLVYGAVFTVLTGDAMISAASSTTLIAITLLGLDGTSPARYIVVATPATAASLLLWLLGLIPPSGLIKGLLVVAILCIADAAIYLFMSRRRVCGYRLPDVGTLFLRNWLDKRTDIEEFFEKCSSEELVNPRVIELPGLLVVYTDVHYGPFSNVGSSRLPEIIQRSFEKLGVGKVLALHGLGSHDRNIASALHVEEYVRALKSAYTCARKEELLYHGAFLLERGEWRLLGLVFDKASLIFISRPGAGIDDLPYSLQEEYVLEARKAGLGDLVLVDSHNWELTSEERVPVEALRGLAGEVVLKIAELRSRPPTEVLSKYVCFKARAQGLINGEGCVLCIGGKGRESVCLAYLRGNNMKPGVRDMIVEHLKEAGADYIEVVTNDEHSETATRASIVYVPVHESSELLNAVSTAAKRLAEMPWSSGGRYWSFKINVKLMGGAMLDLAKILKSSTRESAALLLFYALASPLILSLIL